MNQLASTNQVRDQKRECMRQVATFLQLRKQQILEGLPRGVDGNALIKKAVFEIQRNPELLKCTPQSLFNAIYEAAVNGLEIGGVRDEAYIVPYGDQATMQPGYRGFISLVRRTGCYRDHVCSEVREKDHFRPIMGTSPDIEHRLPHDIHDRGKVVAYYCVFVLNVSGETVKVCEWKTVGELEEHRDRYSPAYRRGEAYRLACEKRKETPNPQRLSPWHTSFEKMAFKTLIRSLATSGRLPLEESKQQILMRENGLSESTDDEYDSFVNNLLEANEEPQAIGTDADPGEVREDASERILEQTPAPAGNDPWKQFEMELREAQSLGQVTAIRERWMAHFKEEADQAGVGMACDAKEDLIRHGRSDTHTPATVAP